MISPPEIAILVCKDRYGHVLLSIFADQAYHQLRLYKQVSQVQVERPCLNACSLVPFLDIMKITAKFC